MTLPINILYICTHNRCRSALFEAITNQNGYKEGQQRLIAKSAGSAPAGEVHPLTLKYLKQAGYSVDGLTSNSWEDAEYMGDFEPDLLVTVCDNAAGESCPIWLGQLPELTKLHWGLSDPSKNTANEAQTEQNFINTIDIIEKRVQKLMQVADLPASERKAALSKLSDIS